MQHSIAHLIDINELVVDQEYDSLLAQLSDDDFEKLETSILNEGILHPFVINQEKVILDGYTRLRICKSRSIMQVPYITRTFQTRIEEKEFVLTFNLSRRQLSTQQKMEIGLEILKIEMVKAKQRQIQAGTEFGMGHAKEIPHDYVEPIDGREKRKDSEAIIIAAKKVNLNAETLRKAHKIQKLSEGDDDIKKIWDDVTSSKCDVHKAYALLQERERKDEKKQLAPDTNSKYSIVNINPSHYDYKELKSIKLPLEKDAMVWLWSSNQFLPFAFDLLSSWHLTYRTILTWVKTKRSRNKNQWLVDQTEHCLLATIGSPALNLIDQSTVLIGASYKKHQKPPEFYTLIDSLNTEKRIDLFSSEGDDANDSE